MNFHPGAMGIQPTLVKSSAVGIDQRYSSWDVAIVDACRVSPVLVVPRLVFYCKLPEYETAHEIMLAYKCVCGVGDCRPEAGDMTRLQKLCHKSHMLFYRAQYNTVFSNVPLTINSKEMLLTLERTLTLNEVFFAVSTGIGLALPQNFRDICGGDFVKEMSASTCQPVIYKGNQWSRWTEGAIDDHAFHAINYALVAYQLAKLDKRTDSTALMAEKGLVKGLMDDGDDDGDAGDAMDVPLWGEDGTRMGAGVVLEG